ncbi:P-loop containing nucleoside triphosphate hydrolase protein [Tricharina praecox]|uniref:P-loop containing nucleoside triphosphate hydrolase protein n=1 Tax=Tricharina praecox TaxID=43433 RepID=UPI002220996F|nr:P-loop containing nucleoside triphosphate hydrolase protein [Tricharina praecox]KAI5854126.1 P-loop containing nucleoside triphosphate hydrolase protein [Tricharina praecox]
MAARIHHLAAVSRRWTSNPRLMPNLPPTPSRSTFRGLRTRPRAVPAPPPITPTAGVNLSPEQLTALKLVGEGKNVFITGRAGTGKSKLIAEIRIQAWNRGRKCIVTAPTGVAALLVGGKTLHSWLGVGHGDEHFQHYIDNLNPPSRLSSQEKERDDWQPCSKVNLLIIDEISMVSFHSRVR